MIICTVEVQSAFKLMQAHIISDITSPPSAVTLSRLTESVYSVHFDTACRTNQEQLVQSYLSANLQKFNDSCSSSHFPIFCKVWCIR